MARRLHHNHHANHLEAKDAMAIPATKASDFAGMIEGRIPGMGSLVKRQSAAATSSSPTCSSTDSSGTCQKASSGPNISLPVALGVVYVVKAQDLQLQC